MPQPVPESAWHVDWFIDGNDLHHDVTVIVADKQLVEIRSGCTSGATRLGHVALVPGLVNCHTHLEFSLLTAPLPATGRFTDWIRSVVNYRRSQAGSAAQAISAGIQQSVRSGTTLIGDIATTGWQPADYVAAGFTGVVFQELLGLTDERVASQVELARTIAAHTSEAGTGFGLSPHAPYSVHPDLLRQAIQSARDFSRPVAMHLAETTAELELLAEATGELRSLLTDFGIWRDGLFGGQTPRQYLEALAAAPRALVIHGNYLDEDDLEFLAAHRQMTLVYCPRTHAYFGHRPHPWQRLLERGGSVAIGTDSRASNPDLSLFAELQFLAARHPQVSHFNLLNLGTSAGRRALLGEELSSAANYCAIALGRPGGRPADCLFDAESRVIGTLVEGQWHEPANLS